MSVPAWQRLAPGNRFRTPAREVTAELVARLVDDGGFTHPLFTDPEYVRAHSPFPATPLPGQGLLLLAGGLAEQSGLFDESVVALVGFERVAFRAPAVPGDVVTVEIEVTGMRPAGRPDRGVLEMRWTARRADGTVLMVAEPRMLLRTGS